MTTVAAAESRIDSARKNERFYRPELDCLRFFAFLAVYVFHTLHRGPHYYTDQHVPFATVLASAASAGRFGVDLFFLLSAYLITELLLREWERYGKVDLRAFYVRRILRIWPLYFFALLIGALLPLFDSTEYFPLKYVLAFVFLVGNWLPLMHFRLQSVMWVLWSVNVEEQFYLLWPAFLSRAGRRKQLLYAAAVLVMIGPVARLLLMAHARSLLSSVLMSSNTLTRLDPLALGIGTAVLLWDRKPRIGMVGRLACLFSGGAVWLVCGHYYSLRAGFLVLGYPAIALGAWLIFYSVLDVRFAPRWVRYLGKISYGLYVFHQLALYLAAHLLGRYQHTVGALALRWWVGLAMTFSLSALSYRFYESPFLRLKQRFTRVQSRPV